MRMSSVTGSLWRKHSLGCTEYVMEVIENKSVCRKRGQRSVLLLFVWITPTYSISSTAGISKNALIGSERTLPNSGERVHQSNTHWHPSWCYYFSTAHVFCDYEALRAVHFLIIGVIKSGISLCDFCITLTHCCFKAMKHTHTISAQMR